MASIHPTAIVDPKATLHEDVEIGPYCTIGPDVTLRQRVRLISHVVVDGLTEVGVETTVYPFAVLGAAPQHVAHKGERTRLTIGERNVIREHVTMHTGTALGGGHTIVGSDSLFMVGAHIAHDCVVADQIVMANNATLGGHVQVDSFVFMGGLSGVHQHTRIGRYAFVAGMAGVMRDLIPYGSAIGNYAHLQGLNLLGLKRRGFSRETTSTLRAAYRLLFGPEGTFQERLDDVERIFAGSAEVREIIEFIRLDAKRPLCLPNE